MNIKEIVNDILNYQSDKKKYIDETYNEFKKTYPFLVSKLVDENDNIDINILKNMLSLLEEIKDNKISQFDASANIGQKLFDKYINKPSCK